MGGDAACDHAERMAADVSKSNGLKARYQDIGTVYLLRMLHLRALNANTVTSGGKCGARRIDQQSDSEETLDAYVAALVDVFRRCEESYTLQALSF